MGGQNLVNDAYFGAVGCPLHVSHHRLVAVVDHLLEPHACVCNRGHSIALIFMR